MKRTFAIGDLHGHFDQLLRLYDQLLQNGLTPEKDTLVFLGDYVDGGNQVKQTLDWLIKKQKQYPHWQFLIGNHELLMLDALVFGGRIYGSFDLWYQQGGKETFYSYLPDSLTDFEKAISNPLDHIPVDHLDWLRTRPYYYEDDNYFFVHAGIPNKTSLSQFKTAIDNNDLDMQQAAVWIRDEFLQSVKDWGKKIVFGHTVFPHGPYRGADPVTMKKTSKIGYPFIQKNKIGIDGMMHNEGNLIAINLPDETFFFEHSK